MNRSLKDWLGQVTTGQGFMVIASTLLAAMSGTLSWPDAAPLLVAGVVGLAWPENTGLKSAAQTIVADVAGMIVAYRGTIASDTKPAA